jgi:hypothetical protein
MSPTSTALKARALANGRHQCQTELEDQRRLALLKRLQKSGLRVTEWEEGWMEAILRREAALGESHAPHVLSERERAKCDQLGRAYGARLYATAPLPLPPPAAPGHCGFTVRGEDGRRVRCGAKAQWRTPRGLELCQEHHEEGQKWKARQKELKARR